jgi:hypothetical protein
VLEIYAISGGSTVVETTPITALLICIQVNATAFPSCASHQLNPRVELAELMVAAAPISNDFNSAQGQANVRC